MVAIAGKRLVLTHFSMMSVNVHLLVPLLLQSHVTRLGVIVKRAGVEPRARERRGQRPAARSYGHRTEKHEVRRAEEYRASGCVYRHWPQTQHQHFRGTTGNEKRLHRDQRGL